MEPVSPNTKPPEDLFNNDDSDLDIDGGVDLTNISSLKIKRHVKASTAPSENEFVRISRGGSPSHSPRDSVDSISSNLETLMPKKGPKTLTGIGDFIPLPGQYKSLLMQLHILNGLLPKELTFKG